MVNLTLNASNFSLIFDTRFEIRACGWSTVYLKYDQKLIELGEEDFDIILTKISRCLSRESFPQPQSQQPDADGYVGFLVLMGKYSYVAARLSESGLELVFMESDCKLICITHLSWQECESWREKIKTYL